MDLDGLAGLVETLRTRARTFAADLQKSEALTRSVLIDPVLRALGWATDDPAQVRVEFSLGGERADYCLLDADGRPRVLIEAKALNSPRSSIATSAVVTYAFQLLPRLNPDGRLLVGTTDGLRWEFYEVPHLKEPRLAFNLAGGSPAEAALRLAEALWKPLLLEIPGPARGVSLPSLPVPGPAPQVAAGGPAPLGQVEIGHHARPPRELRLPDGTSRTLGAWKDLLAEVANYLVRTQKLTPERCPVPGGPRGSRRYLVATEDRHPSGRKFFAPVRLGNGLWLETHYSAPNMVSHCQFLLKYVGEDPARYQIVF
jgi:hypothetical protein